MTLAMSITNFAIYIAMLFGYEYYLKMRAKKETVFFMATEETWYKVFMVALGGSVFVIDIMSKHASFFVYAVLFLSYTFTFKEIGADGIVNNLKRVPLKYITGISVVEKKHSFNVTYEQKNKKFEMVIRKKLAIGLEDAVKKVSRLIQN